MLPANSLHTAYVKTTSGTHRNASDVRTHLDATWHKCFNHIAGLKALDHAVVLFKQVLAHFIPY